MTTMAAAMAANNAQLAAAGPAQAGDDDAVSSEIFSFHFYFFSLSFPLCLSHPNSDLSFSNPTGP